MRYIVDEDFDSRVLAGSSCAFGVFDGLHLGHAYLIERAIETSGPDIPSLALSFDRDPDELFHPQRLRKLARNEDRLAALEESGLADVAVLPFTESLGRLAPIEFLQKTFSAGPPAYLHVGENFRFGAGAAGTVETLESWGAESGCHVYAHGLVSADGQAISSTRIRLLLHDGNLNEAKRLLGHSYSLSGEVQPGRGQGAGFGFATANLHVSEQDLPLGEGVYAAYALFGGECRKAAVSVGVSPTFEAGTTANVEAHVLGFEGDLLGETIRLEFVEYLRPMRFFDSTEDLVAAISADIAHVEAMPERC